MGRSRLSDRVRPDGRSPPEPSTAPRIALCMPACARSPPHFTKRSQRTYEQAVKLFEPYDGVKK